MTTLFGKCATLGLCLLASSLAAQEANRVELGRLANGAVVTFVRGGGGNWGIEVSGDTLPHLQQLKPAQIEVCRDQTNVQLLAAGYLSVRKETDAMVALAKVAGEGRATFGIEDRWTVSGAVLSLNRKVSVTGAEEQAGFLSAIRLVTAASVKWEDTKFFVPGMSYGDPANDGSGAAIRTKRFSLREDILAAPLFGVCLGDSNWVAVLNLAPRGDTTVAESRGTSPTLVDERIQFGAMGGRELAGGSMELGFWLPGTTRGSAGGFGRRGGAAGADAVLGRYHPVKTGLSHHYQVGFCFGKSASFHEMQRDAWRWAWASLKPKAERVGLEVARKVMMDHLSDHVITAGDFTGVPFIIDAVTGHPGSYRTTAPRGPDGRPPASALQNRRGGGRPWNELTPEEARKLAEWARPMGIDVDPEAHELGLWMKVMSGFVSKGIESADQLLLEGDRDPSPRGQKMRQQGLAIIDTFVTKVSLGPPNGAGFNFYRGQVVYAPPDTLFLRQFGEDVRTLLEAYAREKQAGRNHPEWLAWVKKAADWVLTQQAQDGAFPRSWNAPVVSIKEASGTCSYNVVPMLARLSAETGEKRYLAAAARAGEYVWTHYGSQGEFIGGTTDNPNIVDKEAGMLAMEAYLVLYETTKEAKWLDRAKTAGDFTESWIWIWNVPMPVDADNAVLQWKKGVPTIGVQGISARGNGSVDQYLSWAVPCYARLYAHTKDDHYLEVARVLLHGTKAMLALPGRTYDLAGPGWQQEGWRMGPGRGDGWHRSWLPWVSVNHLHGITGLEEFNKDLFQQLTQGY